MACFKIPALLILVVCVTSSLGLKCYNNNMNVITCPNLDSSVCTVIRTKEHVLRSCGLQSACDAVDTAKDILEGSLSFLESNLQLGATDVKQECCSTDYCNSSDRFSVHHITMLLTGLLCFIFY